jgi:hypothetical protein
VLNTKGLAHRYSGRYVVPPKALPWLIVFVCASAGAYDEGLMSSRLYAAALIRVPDALHFSRFCETRSLIACIGFARHVPRTSLFAVKR